MKITAALALLLGLLGCIFGIVAINQGPAAKLGGTTNYDQLDTTQGYSVSGTTVISSARAATLSALTVTTTNAATSTLSAGCIQMTATSTASPVKLVLGVPQSTATTSQYGATTLGAVYYAYGNCP